MANLISNRQLIRRDVVTTSSKFRDIESGKPETPSIPAENTASKWRIYVFGLHLNLTENLPTSTEKKASYGEDLLHKI